MEEITAALSVHVCRSACVRVRVLPCVPFVRAKLPRASTHIILAKGFFFDVMREGDLRFPPALSLLTRVWVGVTEVPRGVARRSSQPVRGVAEGLRARTLDWLLSAAVSYNLA